MENNHLEQLELFWDGRADRELDREKTMPMKQVHTDLIWREITRCIDNKSGLKILDAGGGPGRFSIPLAKAGHEVTNFDISPKMLDIAREKGKDMAGLEFVQGSITDLSEFDDNSFDLVLSLDSPVSFCYDSYETAISELVRVARSTVILCVMGRLGVITEGVSFDLMHFGRLKTVHEVYDTGTLITEELKKLHPSLLPNWHGFTTDEIIELLGQSGCQMLRILAPAALARFVDSEQLKKLYKDKEAYEDYLNFEEKYDSEVNVFGMASGAGGSLLITAKKSEF